MADTAMRKNPGKKIFVHCRLRDDPQGAAMGALKFLTDMGLFIGQSEEFFELLRDLAEDADEARRECR